MRQARIHRFGKGYVLCSKKYMQCDNKGLAAADHSLALPMKSFIS